MTTIGAMKTVKPTAIDERINNAVATSEITPIATAKRMSHNYPDATRRTLGG